MAAKCVVNCPKCGQRLSAPVGHTGRLGCQACKHEFGIVDGEVDIKQAGEVVDTVAETAFIGGQKVFGFFFNTLQTVLTIVAIVGVIIGLYGALTSNILIVFFGGILAVGALGMKNPWFSLF
jgi:hypothetical protein